MLYNIALFLHVAGALLLAAAVAAEWVCLTDLKKASTTGSVAGSLSAYAKASRTGEIGLSVILIPGIYMAIVRWHSAGWVIIGFIGLILIGAISGTMTRKKIGLMKNDAAKMGEMTPEFRKRTLGNSLVLAIRLRTFIILGVVFMMTVKTALAGSIITLVISIILGFLPIVPRASTEVSGSAVSEIK